MEDSHGLAVFYTREGSLTLEPQIFLAEMVDFLDIAIEDHVNLIDALAVD